MTTRLQTSSPRYAQVEESLLSRIQSKYQRGELLPTQKELAREYETSLITIKRAIDELARKGYLQSTRGRGTVVLRPQVHDNRGNVASWTDTMTGMGRQPSTTSISITVRIPPPEIMRALGLRARERSVRIERSRALDGEPICMMWNELPLLLVPTLPDVGLTEESLYRWMKLHHGHVPYRADEEASARLATAAERNELGKDTHVVMIVQRHTFMSNHRPLELAQMIAPAHRYRYRVEIYKKS
jgi:GntR family transcriptional regulator